MIPVKAFSPCVGFLVCPEPARRLAQALILSERLQAVGAAFDRCRAVRYTQLQRQQRHLAARQQALATSLLVLLLPSQVPPSCWLLARTPVELFCTHNCSFT